MKRKILSLITTLLLTLGVVSTGCSNTNTSSSSMPDTTTTSSHEHTYSSSYEYDDTYHWHPSTCGHDVQGDKGRHEFTSETNENGDIVYTCSICHYSYSDGNNDDKDTYTITWKNYDGTILEIDNNVESGTMPTYDGAIPTKESDGRYNYTFAGWTPDIEPVTKDATYTAIFSSEEITYTVDFDLNGGTSSSYKGPIEVKTFSKDIFFFDCVKEDWQFRGWEYNNEKIFDEKGNQLKNVTLVDNMVFKAIYSQIVKLTITTNMPEAGIITGEGEYPYNTYVDVSVTPNQGYKFVGWYYQNTLLSNEENYKYMMWDKDVTLEARFEKDDFNLRIYTNNEDYGLVLLKSNSVIDDYLPEYAGPKEYGSEVTIAAYSKTDVRFLGWYDENNELVTTNAVYTFVMPNHDYTLEAKWNYFTINYNLNGGVNNPNNPSYYTTDDGNIYLQNPTKEGYEFVGWKYNDEIIDTIDVNLVQDITLEAVWSEYEYEIREDDNGKYAVIIGYDDSITDVIIPENVILNGEQIPVKEISQTAFKNNQKVKSVTVSNKVTTIDEYAFAGCMSLESIYLPTSVTTIGNYAFEDCSKLTIYCETSSESSGWSSYWNYSNRPVIWNSYKGIYGNLDGLEYIAYHDSEGNPYIVITGYNGSAANVVIPEYIEVNGEQIVVKVINDEAFYDNDTITSITISDSVTTIGSYAFYNCSSLTSIYIPDGVTTIGNYAFYKCSKLKTVTIGDNSQLTTIGSSAFSSCSSLTSIYIPDSVTTIGDYAFEHCSKLTIYCEVDSKLEGWSNYWNYSNYWYDSGHPVVWNSYLGVHDTLNGLEYAVCIDDEGKSYIVITGYNGSNSDVVIPEYIEVNGEQIVVKEISNSAFEDNTKITSIYIPDSVTTIGNYAFEDCSNLTIYCEVDSKLEGWSNYWNYSNRPIAWNCISFEITDEGLYFVVALDDNGDKYITIAGYTGSSTNVVIPSSINVDGEDIPVKAIASKAFYNNDAITSISISDSVTTIGSSAFEDCSYLTTVTFGENSQLTTIGESAFDGCSSLTSIYIPDGVTSIGENAFYNCSNLESVTISENSQLTIIGSYAFYNCSSLTSIYISDSVTSIGEYAFYKCSKLKTVTIGDNSQLTTIGSFAFYNCSSLTSIYISDSVTSIGENAFYNCSSLTTVRFGENSQLTKIGRSSFSGCISLASIYIPGSVTSIGSYAFEDCSKLTIYCETSSKPSDWSSYWNTSDRPVVWNCEDYGITVEGIHYVVLIDEENIKYITIIGYTGSSTNVVIPSSINVNGEDISVKAIADKAFYDNDTITSVTISDSVTTIGSSAFEDCSNLTTVTISENSQLTTIGESAFDGCSSLISIYIPDGVTTIGDYAFYNCSSLTTVRFGENSQLTTIGDYAFYNCSSLTTVRFGENSQLTTIGESAFDGCSSLISIYIPDGVTTIGDYAFYNCSSLTTVRFGENSQLTKIGRSSFSGCISLTSIYIPGSVTSIGHYAFSGCSKLTIYCETSSKASGWSFYWNYSNRPVIWNSYKGIYGNLDGLEYIAYHDSEGNPYIVITGYNGSAANVVIPEYIEVNGEQIVVKVINDKAFYDNDTITSITIPDSVTTIGENAFYRCSNLTTVTFGENSQLTTIGSYAFRYCSSLTSIYIPGSVTSIGSYAFEDCSKLTIYCETSSKPSDWSSYWNDSNRPVVWNCTYEEYLGAIA